MSLFTVQQYLVAMWTQEFANISLMFSKTHHTVLSAWLFQVLVSLGTLQRKAKLGSEKTKTETKNKQMGVSKRVSSLSCLYFQLPFTVPCANTYFHT